MFKYLHSMKININYILSKKNRVSFCICEKYANQYLDQKLTFCLITWMQQYI